MFKNFLNNQGKKMKLVGLLILAGLVGCSPDANLKEKMAAAIKENPSIVTDAIKANPVAFVEAFQEAARNAQMEMAKKAEDDEKKKMEESFNNPLAPAFRNDETIRGNKDGQIVLVEYSDFECPFCKRGFETVMYILKKYDGKIKFVYKHLPLSFHQNATIGARYYEACRLQGNDKAFKFHDLVYENQRSLTGGGEKFLQTMAQKAGCDMKKVAKDINDPKVQARIAEDEKEAAKFGMQGTPGFILNGVPIKGAYPQSHFENIVNELVKRGKLKI
jgi:protein-disulfide isomerase